MIARMFSSIFISLVVSILLGTPIVFGVRVLPYGADITPLVFSDKEALLHNA
jgi:hypothetical protein